MNPIACEKSLQENKNLKHIWVLFYSYYFYWQTAFCLVECLSFQVNQLIQKEAKVYSCKKK